MESLPSSSNNPAPNLISEHEELHNLNVEEGITVWGRHQETLEQQALQELEIFSSESKVSLESVDKNLEEGEIVDDSDSYTTEKPQNTLDIDTYIKRQEELRKIQEYKKTLEVTDKSKEVADRIAHKNLKVVKERKSTSEKKAKKHKKSEDSEGTNVEEKHPSDSEYVPSEDDLEDISKAGHSTKRKRNIVCGIERVIDDGLIECYEARLEKYYKLLEQTTGASVDDVEENAPEYHSLKGGLKVPKKIWDNLYKYQQEGVKWLWKIHQKCTGGLLGDEMGLGKTVQIIAFLAALNYSRIVSKHGRYTGLGPSIIVCPATVVHQWVKHFHEWIPEFRVAVLHQSGSYTGKKVNLIREINKCKSILITTYLGVLKFKPELSELDWHYIILDEGHKIRNTGAKVSVAVKQLRTPHRLLLTGSPMQNNLQELWSLFDFTNPGMLGTAQTFAEHFANPIIHGGFVNSTPMQEATALSVATALKNIITPYLLRRSKAEVQDDIALPGKSEQVLFCSITDEQRDLYKGYLMGEQVNIILGRGIRNWYSEGHVRANMLVAITTLRKICNHPDLYLCDGEENNNMDDNRKGPEESFGYYKRSGKMIVVSALLKIWKKQRHRVLLFTQGRAMVKVFEHFLRQQDYKYMKMDGSTSISSRQPLIQKFNQDDSYFVFLLTTRVGGLGVNLTGANRVIIFDPDWNPATDTQARERAWRIGQDRQVTIYRLLSAGTIEEKMYQRQVWKQLLSNKVLLDPRTHRFFRTSDLHDLFSLQEQTGVTNPETANIFRESRVKIQEKVIEDAKKKRKRRKLLGDSKVEIEFSEEKLRKMRELAVQISKSLGKSNAESGNEKAKKTPYQLELEEDRKKKLEEKEKLKSMTAMELMIYNRHKAGQREEITNKLDDHKTPVSFDKALIISEKTAKIYHDIKTHKIKLDDKVRRNSDSDASSRRDVESCSDSHNHVEERKHKQKKKKSKHKGKIKVDESGTIDGEQVEGLIKREIKKSKKDKPNAEDNQDNFVLEKLFSKKGVSGALQHDSVIQGKPQLGNLRIENEAQLRTDRSLQALRKSRLDNWRW